MNIEETPQQLSEDAEQLAAALATGPDRGPRAAELARQLISIAEEFPDFKRDLHKAVRAVYKTGARTREADMAAVRRVVAEGCAKDREIADETGLPLPEVREIVERFVSTGEFELRPRSKGSPEMLICEAKSPSGDSYSAPAACSLPTYSLA